MDEIFANADPTHRQDISSGQSLSTENPAIDSIRDYTLFYIYGCSLTSYSTFGQQQQISNQLFK